MKLFRKLKKGFTLVELVVVIAVIAILAAASVVTYIGVTNNAKKSVDSQVLEQVNNALMLRETNDGEKPETMHDALNVLNEDLGVSNIEKLLKATYSKYEFAYDLPANRFVLLEGSDIAVCDDAYTTESTTGNEVNFWKVASSIAADDVYSHYCASSFTAETVTTCSGFDYGDNTTVKSINYVNSSGAKNVIIRTGGGTLKIDGEYDTVRHYGELDFLNIEAVETSSFHEFGYSDQGQIKTGRVVIEDVEVKKQDGTKVDAALDSLYLIAKSEGTETEKGSFDEIIIQTKGDAKMPTLDRSQVVIGDGVRVCEVVTDDEDNAIWLTSNGIYENVTVTEPEASEAGVTAPTEGTDTDTAAWQIANAANRNDQGQLVAEDGETVVDKDDAVVEEKASNAAVEQGDKLFSGGSGTENNPFLISDYEEFVEINKINYIGVTELDKKKEGYSFKLIGDIDVLHNYQYKLKMGTNYISVSLIYFNGCTLDGNGHAINICYYNVIYSSERATFKNLVINGSKHLNPSTGVVNNPDSSLLFYAEDNVFENIRITGEFYYSGNCGVACIYSWGDLEFTNCVNEANLSCVAYNAIFVGYQASKTPVTYTFNNCVNQGEFVSEKAGMFLANPCNSSVTLIVNNCRNDGVIRQTIDNRSSEAENYYFALNSNYGASSTIIFNGITITADQRAILPGTGKNIYGPDDTIELTINADKTISFTKSSKSNVSYYIVTVMTYVGLNENGSGRVYRTERIDATDADAYTSTLKVLQFTKNKNSQYTDAGELCGYKLVHDTKGNLLYLVEESDYNCGSSDLCGPDYIAVSSYDVNGTLLSTSVL